MQLLQRYEESVVDLETLLKIDPNNSAAKKELRLVIRSKEEEVRMAVTYCLFYLFGLAPVVTSVQ